LMLKVEAKTEESSEHNLKTRATTKKRDKSLEIHVAVSKPYTLHKELSVCDCVRKRECVCVFCARMHFKKHLIWMIKLSFKHCYFTHTSLYQDNNWRQEK